MWGCQKCRRGHRRAARGSATVPPRRHGPGRHAVGLDNLVTARPGHRVPDATSACQAAAGFADGPLFRAVRRGDNIGGALGAGDVARIFKRLADQAGIDADGISGHSTYSWNGAAPPRRHRET